jgi:flagellar L-ring protein precursor FlgH
VYKVIATSLAAVLLSACGGMPRAPEAGADADYGPIPPSAMYAAPAAEPGTIYNPAGSFDLFMDLRARAIGDILTVMLVERTNASKESSTSTAKGSSVDTGFPVFAGRPITSSGTQIFNNEIGSESTFDGQADSSQSNRLDGSITVTVAERLPNGNLLVRGEKRITINQGEEFIRLQGIIRPVDIGPQNTVPSTKVADAQISYSGKGTLADANRPGWLSRFFNSPWFPF